MAPTPARCSAPARKRATVLPGVTVKTHAIIAAGSVISKDAEPYMIYVGNPAVAVKERIVRGENNNSR